MRVRDREKQHVGDTVLEGERECVCVGERGGQRGKERQNDKEKPQDREKGLVRST